MQAGEDCRSCHRRDCNCSLQVDVNATRLAGAPPNPFPSHGFHHSPNFFAACRALPDLATLHPFYADIASSRTYLRVIRIAAGCSQPKFHQSPQTASSSWTT